MSYTDDAGVQLNTGFDYISDLAPGTTAQWKAMAPIGDAEAVTCLITSVENSF